MRALSRKHCAFTLIELLLVISVIAMLIGILLPALAEAKRTAKLVIASANLKTLGTSSVTYATENKDGLPSYSWREGRIPVTPFPELRKLYTSDLAAAQGQLEDIIRRLGPDKDFRMAGVNLAPWPRYSHMVMSDHMAQRIPEKSMADPTDVPLLNWQRDPKNWTRYYPGPTLKTTPYRSSYFMVYSHWVPDRGEGAGTVPAANVGFISIPTGENGKNVFGRRRYSDIASPQQKVAAYNQYPRHFGPKEGLWMAYPESKQPLLFYDASVRVLRSDQTNRGWDRVSIALARNMTRARSATHDEPEVWEPPLKGNATSYTGIFWYATTRGGLQGIDTGGREINTSSWIE